MEYPLTLYYDTEVNDVEIKDSSHGDSDFRKAYIVNDGTSKIVVKHFSNSFSNQNRIMGWFRLMDEYRIVGLYCPVIIPNRYGELLHKHTIDGRDYYIYAEEFAAFKTASQLDVEKKKYMPDVLRNLGTIASKRLDFLDFPSAYCLLESFADEEFTDEETECALLFVDYIKKNLPQYLPRAEKLLDLFYRNQEECRKVYASLPTSCFQADLNSSNILLDDNLKFVGLFDFNLCGKEKILNYAMREALWATYQDCLVDKDNNYIFYFDKKLDDIRMKSFLENMSYIQETYTFSDEEKKAFPILLRYINTFWWYSLSDLEFFSKDNCKVEKLLDWFEFQMTRDDLRLMKNAINWRYLFMDDKELMKLSAGELTDLGICPTCFNRKHNGAVFGDNSDKLLYEDDEIECFFVGNPRAEGHMCISTMEHYHDLSEAPDVINEKIIRFSKQFMIILKEVYKCERVYMCTMCDGPNNHYHIQLIPRYSYEKRGSGNFVKERHEYVHDEEKYNKVKSLINEYIKKQD